MNIVRNVPRLPNSLVSYQGRQPIWIHRTHHNMHTHTGNTRQPEPQLKSSSCSSVILSHNSRDAIPIHNSMNAKCLTPISSHNSRDTFRATTQGTPASLPLRSHPSLVDHAHQKQSQHFCFTVSLGAAHKVPGASCFQTVWRGIRAARRQAPHVIGLHEHLAIVWRSNSCHQEPYQ